MTGPIDEKLAETLLQGYNDEVTAATDYLNFAKNFGDISTKIAFLNYTIEEANHAVKLLQTIKEHRVPLQQGPLAATDVIENLVEYIAHEESALFYYDVLKKLSPDEYVVSLCSDIEKEEARHLATIREILKSVQGVKNNE